MEDSGWYPDTTQVPQANPQHLLPFSLYPPLLNGQAHQQAYHKANFQSSHLNRCLCTCFTPPSLPTYLWDASSYSAINYIALGRLTGALSLHHARQGRLLRTSTRNTSSPSIPSHLYKHQLTCIRHHVNPLNLQPLPPSPKNELLLPNRHRSPPQRHRGGISEPGSDACYGIISYSAGNGRW